jgi:hypothetical protein
VQTTILKRCSIGGVDTETLETDDFNTNVGFKVFALFSATKPINPINLSLLSTTGGSDAHHRSAPEEQGFWLVQFVVRQTMVRTHQLESVRYNPVGTSKFSTLRSLLTLLATRSLLTLLATTDPTNPALRYAPTRHTSAAHPQLANFRYRLISHAIPEMEWTFDDRIYLRTWLKKIFETTM